MVEPARPPFPFERRGSIGILTLLMDVERLPEWEIDRAVGPVLEALKQRPVTGLIIDLSQVGWVGSYLLGTLFRLYKRVVVPCGTTGGLESPLLQDRFVVAGPSDMVRQLLELTCLATLWRLYSTRSEALAALEGGGPDPPAGANGSCAGPGA